MRFLVLLTLAACAFGAVTEVTEEAPGNRTREEIIDLLTTVIEERKDVAEKMEKFPPPLLRFIAMKNRTDIVRVCVTTPCEMRKCNHLAQIMTYEVTPRKEWFCQQATSAQQCLFWVERGWSDIATVRDLNIYLAKTKFNVTAFAYETIRSETATPIEKRMENITLAVVRTESTITNFEQMRGQRVCSANALNVASFINPVCSLIKKNTVPATGNAVESATDFFGDMCVPGALNTKYDVNGTFPDKLVSLCPDQASQEQYSGVIGSLRCIMNGVADIVFIDHKAVRELQVQAAGAFELVCADGRRPLSDWEQTACHAGYTPRPVTVLTPTRNQTYKTELLTILQEAAKLSKSVGFSVFDSSDYKCVREGANRNLIFMDDSEAFSLIEDEDIEIASEYFQTFNTCQALQPKPRAKICTTTPAQYQKCITMKTKFNAVEGLKNISWGCVLARSKMDCMRNVLNGTADLYSGDVEEIFIGGNDMQLQPMMTEDFKLRFEEGSFYNATVKTYSIAIMKKSKLYKKFGSDAKVVNIRNLTVCSPGLDEITGFKLPMGHLLSIGAIPRIGSVFESVSRFFKSYCLPGATPVSWDWENDLVLGHEHNWGFPGLNFYNFTGFNWFIWNSPATWNLYNYNRKTPGTLRNFMKNRVLVNLLEGKLTLPEGFDPDEFDYTILDDVLSIEGLGDILSDIPDQVRDRLAGIRQNRTARKEKFNELYEEKTGKKFVSLRNRARGRMTLKGYIQDTFENMQEQWGIFEDYNAPEFIGKKKPARFFTGSKSNNLRDLLGDVADNAEPGSFVSNLLANYDSEYTVPLVARVFGKVLRDRFNMVDRLADGLEILKRIPQMTTVNEEEYSWIKHPAVQAFLRIYAPKLAAYHANLFDNSEVVQQQFSRYLNPLWLSPSYKDFLQVTKAYMTKLIDSCRGYGQNKGVANENEPFYGIEGSLRCISETEGGDIALVDTETIENVIQRNDYVLISPLGLVQDLTPENVKNSSFGTVPHPAIMTAFNTTGSWRWNVTRALLYAQKIFPVNSTTGYTMFGSDNGVFNPKTKKLYPVPINMQNYQSVLGPRLTHAFEAIIKPSAYDWWKERRAICSGETYSNIIERNNGTCRAITKDVTCSGLPRPKVVSIGLSGNKQPVVVRMCSRPTRFIRQVAEFTCENGHGFITPVMTPTACECVPCDEIEYKPTWTDDSMWTSENRLYLPTQAEATAGFNLWGNAAFWSEKSLNPNNEIGVVTDEEEVEEDITKTNKPLSVIKPTGTCEANWYGKWWNPEWFPATTQDVCVGPITGLRRILTNVRAKSKIQS